VDHLNPNDRKLPLATVYLAGPITGCEFRVAQIWRDFATRKLAESGIRCLSPIRFYPEDYGPKDKRMPALPEFDPTTPKSPFRTHKGLTSRDRNDVMTSNLLLVNLLDTERVSIGTMIELGWADLLRIPIVVAMNDNNLHDHAMVREIANYIVPTLDEAIQVTKDVLCF
jgi:nucleoside 2-deoxyribosyltransferase